LQPSDPSVKSVFVAERDQRLQDAIREKLKKLGYRVFLAADPLRALDRFRQQAFDALVMDAGTTGEEGLQVFDRIMYEAARRKVECAGILILREDQAEWAERVQRGPQVAVMIRPVTLKDLHHTLQTLVPLTPPEKRP
jgi:CheY-like chemotaxis protein